MELPQNNRCDFDKSPSCQDKLLKANRLSQLEERAGASVIKEGRLRCRGPIPDSNSPDGFRCLSRFVLPEFNDDQLDQQARDIVFPQTGKSDS